MSEPVLPDFTLIKFSDMEVSPSFTTLCGIVGVQINETAETTNRRVRDCAKPNKPGVRRVKVLGVDWTVTGSGRSNSQQRAIIKSDLLGKKVDYKFEHYRDDGTDAGKLLGTDAGTAVMTASNMSTDPDAGTSDHEFTFEGEGELVYTDAAGS